MPRVLRTQNIKLKQNLIKTKARATYKLEKVECLLELILFCWIVFDFGSLRSMFQKEQGDNFSQNETVVLDFAQLNQNKDDDSYDDSSGPENNVKDLRPQRSAWLERRYSFKEILCFLKILSLALLAIAIEYGMMFVWVIDLARGSDFLSTGLVFHNPYCNFLFRCGCTWNWSGGWEKCNFHNRFGTSKFVLFLFFLSLSCSWQLSRSLKDPSVLGVPLHGLFIISLIGCPNFPLLWAFFCSDRDFRRRSTFHSCSSLLLQVGLL